MKHIKYRIAMLVVAAAMLTVAAGIFIVRYTAAFQELPSSATFFAPDADTTAQDGVGSAPQKTAEPVEYTIQKIADTLFVPWSIVIPNPAENRLLVAERSGAIRIIENATLKPEPLHTFSEVKQKGEEGLMGMAVDPQYPTNKFVYACMAVPTGDAYTNRVVRFVDSGNSASSITTIFDNIPAAQFHAGCRLAFGPDEKLYITTGDALDKNIAQDINSLGGKILRINSDGSIPADNPFANSAVYSYGHRNPQGISWHPVSGVLLSTEHGPSLHDGPAGGDEINAIQPGKNYGWPVIHHDEVREGMESPLLQFTPAVAPGSALVYSGRVFPQWTNTLLFGALIGEGIYSVSLSGDTAANTRVSAYQKLSIDVGRVRDVIEAQDGSIYFSTSNRDGRGDLRAGDDAIYRIIPKN